MRGLTTQERDELATVDDPGEAVYYKIEDLLERGLVEEYDHRPDGTYRIRPTDLGLLALRLWPLNRV